MLYQEGLELIANLAAILTAVLATLAYVRFVWAERARRQALEAHLKEEKLRNLDEGKRTVMHLMAYLSMSETEVLHAAFQSKKITCSPGMDEQMRANRLYFEYGGDDLPAKKRG